MCHPSGIENLCSSKQQCISFEDTKNAANWLQRGGYERATTFDVSAR